VRHFETELTETQTALPQLGAPDALLIVAFDNHFLGYRHAGFYLPGYLTLEYPEATLIEGKRIFAMQGRESFLLSQLPAASYSRFVLFPLPAGQAEYVQYLEKVTKLLPTKDLTSVVLEGHKFVSAPIADLPLLFPDAAKAPTVDLAPKVYTPRTTPSTNP
jgi:hypothetical protein